MTLSEFRKIYGFNESDQCCNPERITWYVQPPLTAEDIAYKYLLDIFPDPRDLECLLYHDDLSKVKTIFIPLPINNPRDFDRENFDMYHFDPTFVGGFGKYISTRHPSRIVFSRNIKSDTLENPYLFDTFGDCANKCNELNQMFYKHTLPIVSNKIEFYSTIFAVCKDQFVFDEES